LLDPFFCLLLGRLLVFGLLFALGLVRRLLLPLLRGLLLDPLTLR